MGAPERFEEGGDTKKAVEVASTAQKYEVFPHYRDEMRPGVVYGGPARPSTHPEFYTYDRDFLPHGFNYWSTDPKIVNYREQNWRREGYSPTLETAKTIFAANQVATMVGGASYLMNKFRRQADETYPYPVVVNPDGTAMMAYPALA